MSKTAKQPKGDELIIVDGEPIISQADYDQVIEIIDDRPTSPRDRKERGRR